MLQNDSSNIYKGIALFVCGVLLFCYSTGLISRALDIVVIVIAIGMAGYGFVLLGGHRLLSNLFGKKKQK